MTALLTAPAAMATSASSPAPVTAGQSFGEEVLRPNVRLIQSDSIGPVDVGWDGRPLKGVIGLDTETEAIDGPSRIPRLALVSASDGFRHVIIPPHQLGRFLLARIAALDVAAFAPGAGFGRRRCIVLASRRR